MILAYFDRIGTGHHGPYLQMLVRYLAEIERDNEVLVIAGNRGVGDDDVVRRLAKVRVVPLKHLDPDDPRSWVAAPRGFLKKIPFYLRTYRELRAALRMARDRDSSTLHFLEIDRIQIPLWLALIGERRTGQLSYFGTLHWSHFLAGEHEEPGTRFQQFYNYLQMVALRHLLRSGRLKRLFVHAEIIRERVSNAMGLQIQERTSITRVPYPVESNSGFELDQQEARSRLNIPSDRPVVLLYGVLRRRKGLHILLEALQMVSTPVYLVIAGHPSGYSIDEIRQLAKPAIRSGRIQLIPFFKHISQEETPLFFRAADIVALPYQKEFKGVSGPLLLSALAERPVVATDVGEMGSTVREWGTGIVSNPDPASVNDALEAMLTLSDIETERFKVACRRFRLANTW